MLKIPGGTAFEDKLGYSRAVVKGRWCFVSGVTGYDYDRMLMPDDAADQATNCFESIKKALAQAGFSLYDTVRVQYTVSDVAIIDEIAPVLSNYFGEIRPAATIVVAGLMRPEMKVEIEVTALKD